jgi:hypothetical protein
MMRFTVLLIVALVLWFVPSTILGLPHWVDLIAVFVLGVAVVKLDQALERRA